MGAGHTHINPIYCVFHTRTHSLGRVCSQHLKQSLSHPVTLFFFKQCFHGICHDKLRSHIQLLLFSKWKFFILNSSLLILYMLLLKYTQSCPILYDPMDYSPPGSSVHGILQAGIPEWVAIPFSRGSSQFKDQTWVSGIVGRFFTSEPPGKPIINSIYAFIKTHSNTIKMFKLVNEMSL